MRITVFGSTGQIGRLLVIQAIEEGYQVVAYTRDRSKLASLENPQLTIIEGQLNDSKRVEEAITGSDAVLSMLGPDMTNKVEDMPVAMGTQNIVDAMEKLGVKRLIAIGTPSSIPSPDDKPTLKIKSIRSFVKHTMANAFYEFDKMGDIIQKSSLDWTVVRFLQPTDEPKKGNVKHGFIGKTSIGMQTTRADIADFSLKQVTDKTYIRKMPAISN